MMSLAAGINSSTQSCSCVVIDPSRGKVVYRDSVNYGELFGDKYGIRAGFMDNGAGWVHSPPLMWIEALDALLGRMQTKFSRIGEIAAIGGAGQQHGTVYLNDSARAALQSMDPGSELAPQLQGVFSRATSPIWRDSSTAEDCQALAAQHGGPMAVAERTGSVPTRRFSGPQIHKFARTEPKGYEDTAHIALVSSFICSLLIGDVAPVDYGDGAGMNLMDIHRGQWWSEAFGRQATETLLQKLPPSPVPSMTEAGSLHPYFSKRYGLAEDCRVLVFSGDNPDSLLGMGVYEPGQMVMSFGTSDTNFTRIPEATHDPGGFANVFGAVTGGYMALSCFANGSLTRESMRDRFSLDWERFSEILRGTGAGNQGRIMLPFLAAEITPTTDGPLERYEYGLRPDDREGCVRGVVEAQFLNMFHFSRWMDQRPRVILATGGASQNREILQIGADVFAATVRQFDITDSVSLGGALRAARYLAPDASWKELTETFCRPSGTEIEPENPEAYEELKQKFAECLEAALQHK